MKLDMDPAINCANGDPRIMIIIFQVSVYRTIDPLVCFRKRNGVYVIAQYTPI